MTSFYGKKALTDNLFSRKRCDSRDDRHFAKKLDFIAITSSDYYFREIFHIHLFMLIAINFTNVTKNSGKFTRIFPFYANVSATKWNFSIEIIPSFKMSWRVSGSHPEDMCSGGMAVRYHSRGSMKLNECILLLAHMVYL